MGAQIAHQNIQNSAALKAEEHYKLHHRKTAAPLLTRGLRIALLIEQRIGQLRRGTVHHFDGPILQADVREDFVSSGSRSSRHRFLQPLLGQAQASLHISGVSALHPTSTRELEKRLDMAGGRHGGEGWGVVMSI